jgi:L-threonylcarbamoyladenylate synthase
MRARLLTPASDLPWERIFEQCGAAIRRGAIVGHPTETLYGLAVDPWDTTAVGRLAAVKGRKDGAGFIVIADSIGAAAELAAAPESPAFSLLTRRFWPGPLTLIVAPSAGAPRGVLGPGGGLALRWTPDPIACEIVKAAGRPLTSTSANLAGEPPAADAAEVLARLGDRIDLVVDGGPRPVSPPSTVLDLLGPRPALLREGAISFRAIEEALGATP